MTVDTSSFEGISVEERGPIAIVKLNRPEKLNAWSQAMGQEFNSYMASLNEGEYRIRAMVLTGEGRAFCSGGDVSGFTTGGNAERPAYRRAHTEHYTVRHMRDCDVPIVGAVNGYAMGMGFGIALGCDLRICSESAIFQVSQTRMGLMADFGLSYFLPQMVGTQRGLELMFTARRVGAQEALDLGLVLEVVPDDQLVDRAVELAGEVAKGPPIGNATSKHVAYAAEEEAFVRALGQTNAFIQHLFRTEDSSEGVKAFMERRDPEFKGR